MRRAALDVVAAWARGEKLGKRAYMLLFDERADFWHRAAEIPEVIALAEGKGCPRPEAVVRCWVAGARIG
jgi:hypothetical protein